VRRPPSTALILTATSVPMFMATLDSLVLSTALPTLSSSLGADLTELGWIVNAFTLSFATLLVTAATLGDRLGRRAVFVAGIVVFGLASAASALATTPAQLIAARAVQGVGGAAIMPLSLTLLAGNVSQRARAGAIGVWGAVSGLGVALGPVIGGAVVEGLSWQAIFWLNVPVAVVSIALVVVALPESYGRRQPLSWPAVLVSGAGVLAVTWGVVRGNDDGWASGRVVGALAGGAVLLVVFVVQQTRTAHPLVPLRLFSSRSFSAANGAGFLFSAGAFGAVFLLSQYLQVGMGYSAFAAGLRTLPWTAAPMVVAPVAGLLASRIGVRPLLVTGLAAEAAGLAWIAALLGHDALAYTDLVPGLVMAGVGMGLTFAPSATAVLADMPEDDHGTANSVNATVREVGTALGVAVLVAVFQAADGTTTPTGFVGGLRPALWVAVATIAAGALVALVIPTATGKTTAEPTPAPELEHVS